ncbi:hypothetical protein ACTPOK_09935 [Streptomyces inhibens]|uniref:hypothetical protein n=1 Tax=Streptomyces inhibens TaxID=2293571 RepID=UPI00402AF7F7
MRARPALIAADLGFRAFAERNQPRYARYAKARLGRQASVAAAVRTTLSFARRRWDWLLSQPSLAADVWEQLRFQVSRQIDSPPSQNTDVAALYYGLPAISADSVLLCCCLGLGIREAAELMGLEPPSVEAGLGVARRALPHLIEGRPTHP